MANSQSFVFSKPFMTGLLAYLQTIWCLFIAHRKRSDYGILTFPGTRPEFFVPISHR